MTTTPADTTTMTGAALAAAYAAGETTPSEVADRILADIEARNGVINAFTDLDPDAVRAAAAASTGRWRAGQALGPLDGVPVTVKENFARVGIAARAGVAGNPAVLVDRDSPVVERLTEDGAVIVGSTTMPDWGMLSSGVSSLSGITRSPWNPEWTVGGSSSGAGAAAAAGFGVIHLGTDIGGSVRLPAAWTGTAAFKPSNGRIPLDNPYFGRSAGPMARTVADLALAMTSVGRFDSRDYTALPPAAIDWTDLDTDVQGRRIALHLDAGAGIAVDPEVRAAVEDAAAVFADAGAEVTVLEPFIHEGILRDIDDFWRVRFWRTFVALPTEAKARVLPYITEWVYGGADVNGRRVLEAYETFAELQRRTVAATENFDAVLSPVAPMAAFPAEWPMPWGFDADVQMAHIGFTLPYNMSGQPATSVNAGFTADGRPIGLQVSGRRFADLETLQLTAWYEGRRPASAVPLFPDAD
ncbi:amidase [Microbacterium sp.]|uniref:amidase n=1 Tax=Microbacterium sp. TaxID=51671 RepID=UPI00373572CD